MSKEKEKDNVFHPQFGKPRVAQPALTPEVRPAQRTAEYSTMLYNDYLYWNDNQEKVKDATKRFNEITNYIFDIVGYRKNDESVALRQGAIGRTSLKDLCAYIVDSSRMQWREKPPFYGAIILEMVDRLALILEVAELASGKKEK